MKKIISAVLILVLLSALLTGCGQDSTITQNKIKYAYEQDLNIIEDNYRNYYEIFVYSFYDTDGDGIGDLNGVTEKLDYVKDMGFNGIWLMPIMPSPTYHKYDVTDYCEVDPAYGTLEDMERLIEECHNRDIRLIIDFVINHTSSQHPWFQEACTYLRQLPEGEDPDIAECPYVDYYHFSKEKENGTYYSVAGADWYYEGSFWSEMPDLNLESELVHAEIEKVADFWLERGIDGFRMDAAMHFEENSTEKNNEVLNWLYTYCAAQTPDFYMVSEVWAGLPVMAKYYGSMTPSLFNFDCASAEGSLVKTARGQSSPERLVDKMIEYEDLFSEENPDYIDAPFLTNHDMARVANNLMNSEDNLKLACGLLMMMNGSPFVYYGEEIGMQSKGTADENKRIPMYWSETDQTGMADGPEDADKDIVSEFPSKEEQEKDGHSLLNYYKRALRLRNENPEIARGSIIKIGALCSESQAAITKTWQDSTIGIVYNTSDEEISINLENTELEEMGIRGYLTLNGEEMILKDTTLTLPAKSICVLK